MSAVLSPGSTLPLIIDPKAFSKVPAAGLPFPSAPCFRTVLAVQGPLRRIFQNRKRFSSAAHTPRALDRSGPFRKPPYEKGKGANAKAKPRSASGPNVPPDGRLPGATALLSCGVIN